MGGSVSERDRQLRLLLAGLPLEDFPKVYAEIQDWMRLNAGLRNSGTYEAVYAASETLADVMVERDPEAALTNLLSTLQGPIESTKQPESMESLVQSVFRKWLAADPAQAVDFLTQNDALLKETSEVLRSDLRHDLAVLWTQMDSDRALAWIGQQPAESRTNLLRSALASLSYQDISKAAELFRQNPDLPDRETMLASMSTRWAATDPAAALAWAASLDKGAAAVAAENTMDAWSSKNFAAARTAFDQLEGVPRDAAARTLSHRFWDGEKADMAGAAAFLEQEPGGPGRAAGIRDLVANWAVNEPEKAATWLLGVLPEDNSLDEAVIELGMTAASRDPAAGATWLTSIHDDAQRRQLLTQSLDAWYKQSPGAVLQWLASNPMNSEDHRVLTERYQKAFTPVNTP